VSEWSGSTGTASSQNWNMSQSLATLYTNSNIDHLVEHKDGITYLLSSWEFHYYSHYIYIRLPVLLINGTPTRASAVLGFTATSGTLVSVLILWPDSNCVRSKTCGNGVTDEEFFMLRDSFTAQVSVVTIVYCKSEIAGSKLQALSELLSYIMGPGRTL
jgi:hypothetical protein